MKIIHLIRHGEGYGNIDPSCKEELSALTIRGNTQASFVADRYVDIPINRVITSTMLRAKQTASIITAKINRQIEYSSLFVEKRRATAQDGVPKDDIHAFFAETSIAENFSIPGYRFSDEENFDDLKARAKKALRKLEETHDEHILIVTHAFFMHILVAYALFGENITARQCEYFIKKFHIEHTGITVMGYNKDDKTCPWRMFTWNDHTHIPTTNNNHTY